MEAPEKFRVDKPYVISNGILKRDDLKNTALPNVTFLPEMPSLPNNTHTQELAIDFDED